MDATLTMKLADELFDIAERLSGAERAGRSQPEPPGNERPAARSEATRDAVRPAGHVTEQASKVLKK